MKEAQSLDDLIAGIRHQEEILPEREIPPKVTSFEASEPEEEYALGSNGLFYTETDAQRLRKQIEQQAARQKPVDYQKRQQDDEKRKRWQRQQQYQQILPVPRAKLFRAPTYSLDDILPETQQTEQMFSGYFGSQHYRELETYLTKVEKREAFPLLGTSRTELRRQNGERGPVAALRATEKGSYIAIDTDYEKHLRGMARGYRVESPLTVEERIAALHEYTLDHENTHRHQKANILAGTPEVVLERDVEETLWKFYNRQMNAYKGTKLEDKYRYLRGITEKRFADAESVYGGETVKLSSYRGATNPSKN